MDGTQVNRPPPAGTADLAATEKGTMPPVVALQAPAARSGGGDLPDRIGPFRVVGLLGRGAFGIVYRGLDEALDRPVAIKVLGPQALCDPEFMDRFRREARALAKVSHPNITAIYQMGEQGAGEYFAMELVEGTSLETKLHAAGRLSAEEAVAVAMEVARGLQAAWKHEVVHRDIKPANILVSADGEVKITDFGLAKPVTGEGDLTATHAVVGSPYYMSPEQARGMPLTAQSDMYSLGVTLYQCLTGRPPFEGTSAVEVLSKHLKELPPALDIERLAIPVSLRDLIDRLLAKDPAKRPQTYDELLHDLRAIHKEMGSPDTLQALVSVSLARPAGGSALHLVLVGVMALIGIATYMLSRLPPEATLRRIPPRPPGSDSKIAPDRPGVQDPDPAAAAGTGVPSTGSPRQVIASAAAPANPGEDIPSAPSKHTLDDDPLPTMEYRDPREHQPSSKPWEAAGTGRYSNEIRSAEKVGDFGARIRLELIQPHSHTRNFWHVDGRILDHGAMGLTTEPRPGTGSWYSHVGLAPGGSLDVDYTGPADSGSLGIQFVSTPLGREEPHLVYQLRLDFAGQKYQLLVTNPDQSREGAPAGTAGNSRFPRNYRGYSWQDDPWMVIATIPRTDLRGRGRVSFRIETGRLGVRFGEDPDYRSFDLTPIYQVRKGPLYPRIQVNPRTRVTFDEIVLTGEMYF